MDCTRVEKLLPLYAGDDLADARESERVAAHLRACGGCRSLAGEWAASRRLTRLHGPPEFDDAFFDGIRSAVMREIAASPPAKPVARLSAWLTIHGTPAYAASVVLLVAAVALTFHLYRQESTPGTAVKNDAGAVQPPDALVGPPLSAPLTVRGDRGVVAASRKPERHNRQGKSKPIRSAQPRHPSGQEEANALEKRAGSEMLGEVATLPRAESRVGDEAEQDIFPKVTQTFNQTGDERKVLRIELQTKDPNVRIIWLSPQPGGQAEPKKETDRR